MAAAIARNGTAWLELRRACEGISCITCDLARYRCGYDGLGLPNFGGAGVSFPPLPGDWFSSKLDGDESAKGLLGGVGASVRLAGDSAGERTPPRRARKLALSPAQVPLPTSLVRGLCG